MKKIIFVFLALVLILSVFASCKSSGGNNSGAANSTGTADVTADSTDESETTYEKQIEFNTSATIPEQTIVDEKGITIKFSGFDYNVDSEILGPAMNFRIENQRTEVVFVKIVNVTCNGIMNIAHTDVRVKAQSEKDEPLYLIIEDMKTFGTEAISEVSFDVVVNSNTDQLISKKNLTFNTNIKDYKQNYDVDGDVVLDNDYITVKFVKKTSDDSSNYCDFVFYNKTDKVLRLTAFDAMINDKNINVQLDLGIRPGAYAFNFITIDKGLLSDSGIEEINDIKFKIDIYDYYEYKDLGFDQNEEQVDPIATTDEIVIK